MKRINTAFTLAEVLITLGTIGVVAAITMPSLIQNYNEKATVKRVQVAYSLLNEAVKRAIVDYGTVDNWCNDGNLGHSGYNGCSLILKDILMQYISAYDNCTKGANDLCFAKKYVRYFNSTQYWQPHTWTGQPSFITKNGISVNIDASNGDGYAGYWCRLSTNDVLDNSTNNINLGYWRYMSNCGVFMIDINGLKGPNVDGKDLFAFILFKDGLVPKGRNFDHSQHNFENNCKDGNPKTLGACTAWVLQNQNLDYLHCNDLDWNTKTKCK